MGISENFPAGAGRAGTKNKSRQDQRSCSLRLPSLTLVQRHLQWAQ